jgi:hypothetical protein
MVQSRYYITPCALCGAARCVHCCSGKLAGPCWPRLTWCHEAMALRMHQPDSAAAAPEPALSRHAHTWHCSTARPELVPRPPPPPGAPGQAVKLYFLPVLDVPGERGVDLEEVYCFDGNTSVLSRCAGWLMRAWQAAYLAGCSAAHGGSVCSAGLVSVVSCRTMHVHW